MSDAARLQRVQRFVRSARRLADPGDALGRRALEVLPNQTGLSEQGARHALGTCLELEPAPGDLQRLCQSVAVADKAHVSLAANVFTAPLRAIALGLAVAPSVSVRPSRREPAFTRLLHEASEGMFELVSQLDPEPGQHVFAYGSDETLATLQRALPPGVVFHGHGFGIGIVVVSEEALDRERDLAARVALDTVAFDQRGCLSPRLVVVVADAARANAFAVEVAGELAHLGQVLPRGALLEGERADLVRYRATMTYLCEVFESDSSFVVLDEQARGLPIPPTGRNLLVVSTPAPGDLIAAMSPAVAAVGLAGDEKLGRLVAQCVPRARFSSVGRMQQPPLDGPVDRRTRPRVL